MRSPAWLSTASRTASRFAFCQPFSDPHRPPISPTNAGSPGFFVESRTGSKPDARRTSSSSSTCSTVHSAGRSRRARYDHDPREPESDSGLADGMVHEADGRAELYLAWPAVPGCSSRPLPPPYPNAFNVSTQAYARPAQDSVPHGRFGGGGEPPRPVRLSQGSRPARRCAREVSAAEVETGSTSEPLTASLLLDSPKVSAPMRAGGAVAAGLPRPRCRRRGPRTARRELASVGLVRFTPQPRPRWSRPRTQIANVPAH